MAGLENRFWPNLAKSPVEAKKQYKIAISLYPCRQTNNTGSKSNPRGSYRFVEAKGRPIMHIYTFSTCYSLLVIGQFSSLTLNGRYNTKFSYFYFFLFFFNSLGHLNTPSIWKSLISLVNHTIIKINKQAPQRQKTTESLSLSK